VGARKFGQIVHGERRGRQAHESAASAFDTA
jgi:hypothetical protein